MSGQLEGRTAVVTGSSSGIGKATAIRFANEGARVVTNARSFERADTTAQEIRDEGGDAVAVEADVRDLDELEGVIETAIAEFGDIDVLMNNVGSVQFNESVSDLQKWDSPPLLEMEQDDWQRVIEQNLTSVVFGTKFAAERMIENGHGGQVINTSSIFGDMGVKGRLAYNATKGGVNNLTKGLAVELAEYDISVNALAPGFIDTPNRARDDEQALLNRIPLGRYGTREQMAHCAAFLAAGDHYITGEIITADGGWSAHGWGSKGE